MLDRVLAFLVKAVLALRYRIRVRGLKRVKARGRRGILFLPNHPALIDPVIVLSRLLGPFAPRALADRRQIDRFFIRRLARRVGAIPMDDPARIGEASTEGIRQAVDQCIEVLRGGGNVLLYPAGHILRSRYEDLGASGAVRRVLDELPDVRVVLVRTTGLWGSRFSWASGREPHVAATMKRGLLGLLASGLWFMPKRRVTMTFCEPDDLPHRGGRHEINRRLEAFYNAEVPPNTWLPLTPWQGGARVLGEPQQPAPKRDVDEIPAGTRQAVIEHLLDVCDAGDITAETDLARDLGMDSLTMVALAAWLQAEFGATVENAESLRTAGDVMRAAAGQAATAEVRGFQPPRRGWFSQRPGTHCPDDLSSRTIPQAFLAQAERQGGRAILADQTSGVRSYRDVLTAVAALRGPIGELDGQRIGVMLPAGVGATVLTLAVQFAGKTPAMVNWTLGAGVVVRCLDAVDVRRVLTSRVLVERLGGQGVDLDVFAERFVFIEDIRAALSRRDKLAAAMTARFRRKPLHQAAAAAPPTAAILFTSGSEAEPKAVPLSHRNILTNVADAWQCFRLGPGDCLLGILPPFHSFGLTTSVVLPLVTALPCAYSPNPTDAAALAVAVEGYRTTLLAGTPTFLHGLVRAATEGQLDSLTLVVSGAEACGEEVYAAVERSCPQTTILEGYGATECSPIIAVNRQDDPRRRTIGRPLASFECVRLDPETRQPVGAGHEGLLLVRGPCVFDGYLNRPAEAGFVEHDGRQWYDTGDVIYVDDEGIWSFAARLKRFVKVGGEMLSLPAIEATLRGELGDAEQTGQGLAVIAVGADEQPELCLVATTDVTRAQANAAIRDAGLSGLHNIRRVERIDELPLLGNGKIDYRSLGEQFA